MTHELSKTLALAALLLAGACQSTDDTPDQRSAIAPGEPMESAAPLDASASAFAKPGFHVEVVDGRLWIFRADSEDLQSFLAGNEPAKNVTVIGGGPRDMSMRSVDRETIDAYLYSKPGFIAETADIGGSKILWVFRDGTEALAEFRATGEPAKNVTLIGAGPNGMSLRGPDRETIDAYISAP